MDSGVTFDPNGRFIGLKLSIGHRADWTGGPYVRQFWRLDTVKPAVMPGVVPDRWGGTEIRMIADRDGHTVVVYPEMPMRTDGVYSDRLAFWDLDNQRRVDRLEPAPGTGITRSAGATIPTISTVRSTASAWSIPTSWAWCVGGT